MRLVWAATAVSLCAGAMITAGCGSSREVVSLDTVANAVVKTEAVDTARVSFQGSVTFNHDHAQRFEFKGHGITDRGTNSAKMRAVYKFPGPFRQPSSKSSVAR